MKVMRFSMIPLSPGAIADCCRCCLPKRKDGRRPISVAGETRQGAVVGIAVQRRISARTDSVRGAQQGTREAVLTSWVACLRVPRRGRVGQDTSCALPGLLLHKCGRRRIGPRVRRVWWRRLPAVDRRLATARSGMDPVPLLRDTLPIRLGPTRLGRRPLPVFISRAFADTWSGSCPVHETLADVVYRVLGEQGACSLAAMRRRFAEHMLGDPVAVQAQRHAELDHDHRTGGIGWHWIGCKLQGWRYGPQEEVGEIVKEVGDNVEVDTGFVV